MKAYSSMCDSNRDVLPMQSPFSRDQLLLKGKRKSLNLVAIMISLFAPWLLFCFVYANMSFVIHYRIPLLCYILQALLMVGGVFAPMLLAVQAMMRKTTDPTYQPSWFFFLTVTCFVAYACGTVAGEWNYSTFMQPHYDLTHMPKYKDVDTNNYLGQQLMDAGRIEFKEGTALDLGRSMGFKNHDIYCVAPIATKGKGNPLSADFWAVGKNCCSGIEADFHCPGFSDPGSTSSIRLMNDHDRPFYRLAVQQAEATYKMTATHPLFFRWVHDADQEAFQFAKSGYVNYLVGISTAFVLQLFLVWVCTVAFSKLVHY